MPEKLLNEIRKLEARLERFVENEKIAVKTLKDCILKFEQLNFFLETVKEMPTNEEKRKLRNLRLEALKELSIALEKFSDAEHEKSHLLESYGSVLFELEEATAIFYKK